MNLTERLKGRGYDAVAIVGPTASGKTGLSIALARRCGGEIISCDSMQIYRGMDIGTAKATAEERSEVPHHLIDICPLSRAYSAADYVTDATAAANDIIKRGKLPIFCGGTGLYLESVMRGEYPDASPTDEQLRAQLWDIAREQGNGALHAMLREIDPDAADSIHENNVKRVIRALEIAKCSGVTKTELDRQNSEMAGMKIFAVCLCYNSRELLYSRIDERVDAMLEAGLCRELETLMADAGFMNNQTAMQAIGYKELFAYMRGEVPLAECVQQLKGATRRYAKRQLTWFSHRYYVHPLMCDEDGEQKSTERLLCELETLI